MVNEILVGTADGLHVLGDDRRVRVAGHDVTSLAKEGPGWWAIVDRAALWQSNDADWWSQVASLQELRANCVLPVEHGPYGTGRVRRSSSATGRPAGTPCG